MAKVFRPPQTTFNSQPNPSPEKKPDGKTLLQRWKEKLENNKITAVLLFLVFVLGIVGTAVKYWNDLFHFGDKKPPSFEVRVNLDSPKKANQPIEVKEKFHLNKQLSLSIDKVKVLENLTGMEFAEAGEGKEISIKIISGGVRTVDFGGEKFCKVTGGGIDVMVNGAKCCSYPNAFPSVDTDMTEQEASASIWSNINRHLQQSTDLIQNLSQCLKK